MTNSSGNACLAIMFRRNMYISLSAFNASLNRINSISLISLSTAIIIKSNTAFIINSFEYGNLITNSVDIKLYNLINIYNNCNNLYSLYRGVFIL